MLLPEIKEREYRFRLALRMGLPIFALILAFISNTLINHYESIQTSFFFVSILLLTFSIYFIFFLIYNGFDEKITESVSRTFTREYLYKYLNKEISKGKPYTLLLLSIDNLHSINNLYGIKNGDMVIYEFILYVEKYFKEKKITNLAMGHIKGGDFVIGLDGSEEDYNTLMELLCLKSSEFQVNEIELSISGAITDTNYSNKLDYMIEKLFDLQDENRNKKVFLDREAIKPNDLEKFVIQAIGNKSTSMMLQNVYENNILVAKECFIRLKTSQDKVLHPKSYMKIVNKLGLTAKYDFLVFEKALVCAATSKAMFSITLNPSSLRNHKFLKHVQELLESYDDVKNRIIIMMSESEYYPQVEKYNTSLQVLRRQGIKIGIDRLGTLHTSFLYLRDLELDIARFDSLYAKSVRKQKHKNTIEGFNTMARLQGVKTWLKMVKNKEINDFALDIGIDYTQGKELSDLEKIDEV